MFSPLLFNFLGEFTVSCFSISSILELCPLIHLPKQNIPTRSVSKMRDNRIIIGALLSCDKVSELTIKEAVENFNLSSSTVSRLICSSMQLIQSHSESPNRCPKHSSNSILVRGYSRLQKAPVET